MKNLKEYWTLYLLLVLVSIVGTFTIVDRFYIPKKLESNRELYEYKSDSLLLKIESINKEKDSLTNVLQNTDSQIEIVNHWYEKKLVDITNQPIRDDVKFFSEYLSKVNSGFSCSNNSDTVKTD